MLTQNSHSPSQSEESLACDPPSIDYLLEAVYPELRRVAGALMLRERSSHTLQPTALVHEAVLRLLEIPASQVKDVEHLLYLSIGMMRRVLTSYARRRLALKRSAPFRTPLEELHNHCAINVDDIVILDQLLDRLERIDKRAYTVVTLRFFGDFSDEEIAAILKVSSMTVYRDWTWARIWLFGELIRP